MILQPLELISLAISALLAFITCAFAVELTIRLGKIKNYRVRYGLRGLALFAPILDYFFSTFNFGNLFNPLSCQSCTQKLLLQACAPELLDYLNINQISLIRYLAFEYNERIYFTLFVLVCGIPFWLVFKTLFCACQEWKVMKNLSQQCTVVNRSIHNSALMEAITRADLKIVTGKEISMPMVSFGNQIFIPAVIVETFPQSEYEAILAHESAHIFWKDPACKLLVKLMTAFFWWIPMQSWGSRMVQEQEMSCDQYVTKYQLESDSLASALLRASKLAKEKSECTVCYFSQQPHSTLVRIKALLNLSSGKEQKLSPVYWIVMIVALLILAFCFFKQ
jgi:beta-lactamase regulating signal transducer with metallopeptidase domain